MNSKKTKNAHWYGLARSIAIIAALFTLIISLLLIVNFIQTKSIDPLNSKALNQLMLQGDLQCPGIFHIQGYHLYQDQYLSMKDQY